VQRGVQNDMSGRLLVNLLWVLSSSSGFPWCEETFLFLERVDEPTHWWHRANSNFPYLGSGAQRELTVMVNFVLNVFNLSHPNLFI